MDKTFELIICIDKLGTKKIILEKNTIDEIDKMTTSFESSDEIRCYFSEKIEEFEEKYKEYMESLTEKNNRKEKGDITIIGTINKEKRRIKVLYNKHIEVFEYIIRNEEFQKYLRKNFYEEYCRLQQTKNEKIIFNESISFLIRKIIKIYNQYSKDNNKLPIDTIYKHMQKEKQLLKKYESMYYETSNQEEKPPEQLEAYEIEFIKEKQENQKYDIQEKKGRTKMKKIVGGN